MNPIICDYATSSYHHDAEKEVKMSKKLTPAFQKLLTSRPKGCCVAAGAPKKVTQKKRKKR